MDWKFPSTMPVELELEVTDEEGGLLTYKLAVDHVERDVYHALRRFRESFPQVRIVRMEILARAYYVERREVDLSEFRNWC